ncbi:MAG: NAD(P)H-hydrate epimerase [Endomicrobia bacterium]|nr:NAD(P)H-hydrate epimerase [Endomicrobiia bacterium]
MRNKIYLSSKDIYKIDQLTSDKFLIPSFILMENAGKAAAEFIKNYAKKRRFKKIIVFCGPGKNAGDGFVLARYLYIWGFDVRVIILPKKVEYKGDTALNYEIIKKLKIKITKFNKKIKFLINKYDIIVDAIFGIGLKREVEGIYKEAIDLINSSNKVVFSIDIPSGLQADTGEILKTAVEADYTLSMGFLKSGFKNRFVRRYLGKVKIIDIGYPPLKLFF